MFRIVVISPPGYPHAGAFAELAETLVLSFRALGYQAQAAVNMFASDATNIVLGGHLLAEQAVSAIPEDTIFYNLEQVQDDLFQWAPILTTLYNRFQVWDYSRRNLEGLKARGLAARAAVLKIGTVPEMTRIKPAENQDIDVLFYGTVTERRRKILKSVEKTGLKVTALFKAYGKERDAMIARSKIVLNLHKHDAQIFEIVRVSYLLANAKAVISEGGSATEIEPDLMPGLILAAPETIAPECRRLVKDVRARRSLEKAGYECMSKRSQTDYLRELLTGLPS